MDTILTSLETIAYGLYLYLFLFLITLSIVITIHELGHYWAARLCGVHIQQFSIGFGKEILGITSKAETRYSLCCIPIGGFVKLFGDTDPQNPQIWDSQLNKARELTPKELQSAYCTKSIFQRAFIIFAGPAINIAFTILIIASVCMTMGLRQSPAEITAIAHDTPAHHAGIQIGDVILAMDDERIDHSNQIYDVTFHEDPPQKHCYLIERSEKFKTICFTATPLNYISDKGIKRAHNQTGMVRMERVLLRDIKAINGTRFTNTDAIISNINNYLDKDIIVSLQFKKEEEALYSIHFPSEFNKQLLNRNTLQDEITADAIYTRPRADYSYKQLSPVASLQHSFKYIKDNITESYLIISAAIRGENNEKIIGGVGSMSEKTAQSYSLGLYEYFSFIAALSLMVAIINLMPIPALDGGYLFFILIEAIRGKPISPRLQDLLLLFGLVTLGGIMIWANIHDIISHLSSQN